MTDTKRGITIEGQKALDHFANVMYEDVDKVIQNIINTLRVLTYSRSDLDHHIFYLKSRMYNNVVENVLTPIINNYESKKEKMTKVKNIKIKNITRNEDIIFANESFVPCEHREKFTVTEIYSGSYGDGEERTIRYVTNIYPDFRLRDRIRIFYEGEDGAKEYELKSYQYEKEYDFGENAEEIKWYVELVLDNEYCEDD